MRTAHPTDSRARQLDLTAKCRRLARKAIEVVEAADDGFFAGAQRPDLLPAELVPHWPLRPPILRSVGRRDEDSPPC